MANKQLSAAEITKLLAGQSTRGGRKDSTEPRTMENWWRQEHHFIRKKDNPDLTCMNSKCTDPRPGDSVLILTVIKDRLMCRYCFIEGWLSGTRED